MKRCLCILRLGIIVIALLLPKYIYALSYTNISASFLWETLKVTTDPGTNINWASDPFLRTEDVTFDNYHVDHNDASFDYSLIGDGHATLSIDYQWSFIMYSDVADQDYMNMAYFDQYIFVNGDIDISQSIWNGVSGLIYPGSDTRSYNYSKSGTWTVELLGHNMWDPTGTSDTITFHVYREGDDSLPVAPIPEPATLMLLGSGLIGLAGFRKKFKG